MQVFYWRISGNGFYRVQGSPDLPEADYETKPNLEENLHLEAKAETHNERTKEVIEESILSAERIAYRTRTILKTN